MEIPVQTSNLLNVEQVSALVNLSAMGALLVAYAYDAAHPKDGFVVFTEQQVTVVDGLSRFDLLRENVLAISWEGPEALPEVRCRGFECRLLDRIRVYLRDGSDVILHVPLLDKRFRSGMPMAMWMEHEGFGILKKSVGLR